MQHHCLNHAFFAHYIVLSCTHLLHFHNVKEALFMAFILGQEHNSLLWKNTLNAALFFHIFQFLYLARSTMVQIGGQMPYHFGVE